MCDLLEPKGTDFVLDAGTGTGNAAKAMARKVKKVAAVDVVPSREERHRSRQAVRKEVVAPFEPATTGLESACAAQAVASY